MSRNMSRDNFLCGRVARMLSRRQWLRRAGGGAGMIALANMLAEQKLLADKDFAGDPRARLQWFYQKTPFFDERYRLYPIARSLD